MNDVDSANTRKLDCSKPKAELSTLKRGLQALEILNESPLINAQKLGTKMGVPRTTARRLLDTLVAEGFAEKIRNPSSYRLTPRVSRLSCGVSDEIILSHVATPLLIEATRKVGWTFAIASPQGNYMVIQVTTDGISPYSTNRVNVGMKLPITASQSGRMTVAYMLDDERSTLSAETAQESLEPHVHDLWQDTFEQIRIRGCVYPPGVARRRNVVCVPIFMRGQVRAALAMNYFSSTVSRQRLEEEYVPMLKNLSQEITKKAESARL